MKRCVSVIHEGGTTEVQWGEEEPSAGVIDGYVHIDQVGRLVVPFRTDDDEPYVFVLGGNATGIYASEDTSAEQNHDPVWRP